MCTGNWRGALGYELLSVYDGGSICVGVMGTGTEGGGGGGGQLLVRRLPPSPYYDTSLSLSFFLAHLFFLALTLSFSFCLLTVKLGAHRAWIARQQHRTAGSVA